MGKQLRSRLPALVDQYNLELSRKGLGKEHRLTQRKLATETGVSLPAISRIYRNTFTRIDNRTIEKLCAFFNCDLTDLLTLEEKVDERPPRQRKNKLKK